MILVAANIFKDSNDCPQIIPLLSTPTFHELEDPVFFKLPRLLREFFICIAMVGIKANFLHVRPSVCMHQRDRLPKNYIFDIYGNNSKYLNSLKIRKNMGHFSKKT